jgi:hypothetical protein
MKKHHHTVLDRIRPTGPALLAWPTQPTAQCVVSCATRSCRPFLGHFPKTTRQSGVVELLPRRRGTNEGGEMKSAVFDDSDGTPVIINDSGDVLQQGEATRKVRGELN